MPFKDLKKHLWYLIHVEPHNETVTVVRISADVRDDAIEDN